MIPKKIIALILTMIFVFGYGSLVLAADDNVLLNGHKSKQGAVLADSSAAIVKNSAVVDNFTSLKLTDPHIQQTFKQCLPYTLKTTVKNEPDGTTYIITGDIAAMWVRDSCAQIYPYVYLSKNDTDLQRIITGTILRHLKHFNSSYEDAPFINSWEENYTPHEYKWEPDGVAYLIRLSWLYWKVTGDDKWAHLTGDFDAHLAFNHALDLLEKSTGPTGMIKCKNRPSDDWTTYPYLIPTNMFLASMLPKLAEMYLKIWNDPERAQKCNDLSRNIKEGINNYGIYEHPIYGKIWAYEVDGLGNYLLMDDANIPSLLAATYLEFCSFSDAIYQNTRKFALSNFNPYYVTGKYGQGIGSPHTQNFWVWPLSMIVQALTATDDQEVGELFKWLDGLDNNTYYVHESVNLDDPTQYTRSAFAWGNTLYAELVIKKLLGFNFYPDNEALYIKPYLNIGCDRVELSSKVDFGRASGITLHITGQGSEIKSATINGKPAVIDKNLGVKIPEDNVDVIIQTN